MGEELAMLLEEDNLKTSTPTVKIRAPTDEALRQLDRIRMAGNIGNYFFVNQLLQK